MFPSNIQNVTMDYMCSFTVTVLATVKPTVMLDPLLGYCHANGAVCSIANSVNLANVIFYGARVDTSYVGGYFG